MEVIEGEVRGGPCGSTRCTATETRTVRHDIVVGGTLVWSASGAHSGYLAGEARSRGLFLVIDGARALLGRPGPSAPQAFRSVGDRPPTLEGGYRVDGARALLGRLFGPQTIHASAAPRN